MRHSSFWEWEGKLEAQPGSHINDAVPEAIEIARKRGESFAFEFNSVTITVHGDSDAALILRDWQRALSGYIPGPVGPYPVGRLTSEMLASDSAIEKQNEARREASRVEYQRHADAKRAATAALLAEAGPIELTDAEGWAAFKANNTEPYGAAIVEYAEQWARLMQREIARGAKLEDIADRCSHEADTDGITGFMYGCAVATLSKVWIHGEQLRRWHNLKTQIGHEGEKANESGGVLNPALLNLG